MADDNHEMLLRAILSMTARQALPVSRLSEIVLKGSKGSDGKQLRAHNLCDGTRTQGEIAKVAKLDSASFSRTVARWVEAGALFCIGSGRDTKLLHAYPLPTELKKERNGAA
jgi:hypothetical protein